MPVWFNEGIATGFENDGERINIGPTRINALYARQVPRATTLSWQEVHDNDEAFTGDVLAGEAYVHAWSLHWLLVTQHRRAYTQYIRWLRQIEPLSVVSPEERDRRFVEVFGTRVADLQAEFPRLLEAGMIRQKIPPAGSVTRSHLTHGDACQVELTTLEFDDEGRLQVCGQLRNVSPFREFSYYVSVQSDGGLYTDWHLPCVDSLTTQSLVAKSLTKQTPGGPGEFGSRVWVEVICALPTSDEAAEWRRGEYPRPAWEH